VPLRLPGAGVPLPTDITCPHCAGYRGSCHVCDGRRTVLLSRALEALRDVWPKRGCRCDACQALRAAGYREAGTTSSPREPGNRS
jgi:hypothetical protein